jgi:hypothetical protein
MGLTEFQHLLGRLYTDPALLARFEADSRAVAHEFGLDTSDVAQLACLSVEQIRRFADALVVKRANEVKKLLPWTHHSLGPERFAALFRRHAAGYVPAGLRKHRDDAVKFVALIEREVGPAPTWLIDLARLEATLLTVGDPSRRFVARRFRHALADLARVGRGDPGTVLPPRATICLWLRPLRRGPAYRRCLSVPQMRWLWPFVAIGRPGRA